MYIYLEEFCLTVASASHNVRSCFMLVDAYHTTLRPKHCGADQAEGPFGFGFFFEMVQTSPGAAK